MHKFIFGLILAFFSFPSLAAEQTLEVRLTQEEAAAPETFCACEQEHGDWMLSFVTETDMDGAPLYVLGESGLYTRDLESFTKNRARLPIDGSTTDPFSQALEIVGTIPVYDETQSAEMPLILLGFRVIVTVMTDQYEPGLYGEGNKLDISEVPLMAELNWSDDHPNQE